jgi:hypothetical protein
MNTFELCTKRTPRRLGVHAWEKYLTVEEFQELSSCRDETERAEIQLEQDFSATKAQVHFLSVERPQKREVKYTRIFLKIPYHPITFAGGSGT